VLEVREADAYELGLAVGERDHRGALGRIYGPIRPEARDAHRRELDCKAAVIGIGAALAHDASLPDARRPDANHLR
jgi:hypothetical protein